jgi:HD-GYP domain-containing protein (c-di-GMP phosphodiesterase class II)
LVAVALVSVAALGSYAALGVQGEEIAQSVALSLYGQLLSFWLVGILLARGAEREGRLLEGVSELHGRLEQDLQRVVWALTGAVEAKDPYTGGHLQRVNAFAQEVGRRLGLAGRELELLQIASTLHDIGKIGIPESILNKPGPLDAGEWEVMHRHPEIGARLLLRIEGLREAAPLVLHHQERWDGRNDVPFPGYPQGLAGEAIPLGARIIAVVDSFDAMTTDRPYRAAKSPAAARAVLRAERGAQFDPRVVDSFLRLIDELPWKTARGEPPRP